MPKYHEALSWFHTTLRDKVTRRVVWVRNGNAWEVRAVPVDGNWRNSYSTGVVLYAQSTNRQWLVWSEDLPVVPQRGDRIIENVRGVNVIHEVLSGDGEPDWSWADYEHKFLVVRTRMIGS